MPPPTLTAFINLLTTLVALTIPIAVGLALFAFLWGILQGFGKLDSVEKRMEIRRTIVWSIVALLVVATLAGIVSLFTTILR